MSHNIEIEKKFYAPEGQDINLIIDKLRLDFESESHEQDIYFTDDDGKYIPDRTCLRFRNKGGSKQNITIDFKGKSKALSSFFAKVESNITIPKESTDGTYQLFSNLGYQKYVTVNKNRNSYVKKVDDSTYTLAVDFIAGIGLFFELELTVPANKYNNDEARKIFDDFFNVIITDNFEEADLPYRDFLANKIKNLWLDNAKTIMIDFDSALDANKPLCSNQEIYFAENLTQEVNKHQTSIAVSELQAILELSEKYEIIFVSNNQDKALERLQELNLKNIEVIPLNDIKNLASAIAITANKNTYQQMSGLGIKTIIKSYDLLNCLEELNTLCINNITELNLINKYSDY